MSAALTYTANDGQDVTASTTIGSLDQFTGGPVGGHLGAAQTGTIAITGYQADGTAINTTLAVDSTTTLGNLITKLNSTFNRRHGHARRRNDPDHGHDLGIQQIGPAPSVLRETDR